MPNYIMHHGVKEMKHGHRRWQNPDGSLTDAGFIHYYGRPRIRGQNKKDPRYYNKDGSLTKLGQLHYEKKDTKIAKGEITYRVTTKRKEKNKGYSYMTIDEADHEIYKGEAQGGIYDRKTGKLCTDIFSTKYEVTRDILIPSFNKSMDAFVASTYDVPVSELAKEIEKSFGSNSKEQTERFIKNFENMSVQQCKEDAYLAFSTSLGSSEKNRKLFFDELKRQGYSAVWDENDRSNDALNKPLILFEKRGQVKQISSKRIRNDE